MKRKLLLGFTALNVLLFLGNVFIVSQDATDPEEYPYLSKRIFASAQNDVLIKFTGLRTQLNEYVEAQPVRSIGLYFEYLPSGASIGVNDRSGVNIASLLKVPLAMAIYKQYEQGALHRDELFTIHPDDLNSNYGNLWKRGAGATVSVDEAVSLALKESDNTASNVLLRALPRGALNEVADYLDIPQETEGKFIVISPKNYSSILRSLYLSAFLTRSSSSEILKILTDTAFNDRIPAGVPRGTPVAHKIGEYTLDGTTPTVSDCGIVYVPNRPYILCIMMSQSREQAAQHMQALSKLVYNYVVSAKY